MFGGLSLPLPLLVLWLAVSIACAVHVVRTGRQIFWIWIFFVLPGIGVLVYILAEIAPGWFGGRTANRVRINLNKALAPDREYRVAKAALEETPSAGNRLRLGHAAMALDKFDEAESAFREAAQGQFADDPAMLMGHAQALLELKRWDEALKSIEQVRALGAEGKTPPAQLAYARALEGLGRFDEADAPYRFAADRSPGLEAAARYVAFMAHSGRKDDAKIGMGELDRRFAKIPSHFRAEARRWRDYAANAVG